MFQDSLGEWSSMRAIAVHTKQWCLLVGFKFLATRHCYAKPLNFAKKIKLDLPQSPHPTQDGQQIKQMQHKSHSVSIVTSH